MRRTWVGIVLGLLGCGGSTVSGAVSGYPVPAGESVWASLTDYKGAAIGGLLVVSDQRNTCSLLEAPALPASATFVVLAFFRNADGVPLAPEPGEFPVRPPTAPTWSTGVFLRTDANGRLAIPESSRSAVAGGLTVSALAFGGDASGRFDVKFGAQGDAVAGSFAASPCTLDRAAFAKGAIAKSLALPGEVTGPRPGPQPNLTQFWKVNASAVVFGELCSDHDSLRSANPPTAPLNSYIVYRGSSDAKQVSLLSCTTLDPNSCMPQQSAAVLDASGAELTLTRELKTPLGGGGCSLLTHQEWRFIDRGFRLDATISNLLSLVDDATGCATLEAEAKARAPNGHGYEGCRITFAMTGVPPEQ